MSIGKTSLLEKSLKAKAAVAEEGLIAKFDADDDTVAVASSDTDSLIGVFQSAAAAGKRVNVMLIGVADVKVGAAAVTRGDMITSDADGKAKSTTTAKKNLVGVACASGAAGEIIPVLLAQAVL